MQQAIKQGCKKRESMAGNNAIQVQLIYDVDSHSNRAIALWMTQSTDTIIQLSTRDLSLRRITYREWFGGIFSGPEISRRNSSTALSRFLTKNGWPEPAHPNDQDEYETARSIHLRGGSGPVKLLYRDLYRDHSGEYWIQWSRDHPETAPEFWRSLLSHLKANRIDEATMMVKDAQQQARRKP
jgi:hypothetical protein